MNRVLLKAVRCCTSCRKHYISYLLIAFLTVLFQSCELEPNPTGNIIEVQVLNYDGFPIKPGNWDQVYTSIGQYPASLPNENGICRFENVTFPYNLQLGSIWDVTSYRYKNLNSRNPMLLLPPDYYYESQYKELGVGIRFPAIEENKIGLARFISKDLIDSINQFFGTNSPIQGIFPEFETGGVLWLRIPADRNSVSGKLIFLEGEGYWSYIYGNLFMESYEYYGSKDVTLQYGSENQLIFTQDEIQTNPPEIPVSFNVTYPYGVSRTQIKLSLNFDGYCSGSQFLLMQLNNNDGPFVINVPSLSNLNYNVKISSFYDYVFWDRLYPSRSIQVEPGGSGSIVHMLPELLSPENGQENVGLDNYLTVYDDGEKGIFLFDIRAWQAPYGSCHIFTDKNSMRLGDIWSRDFKIVPNTTYRWSVTKITQFNSIDEFTKTAYILNPSFNSVSLSPPSYFKTAP